MASRRERPTWVRGEHTSSLRATHPSPAILRGTKRQEILRHGRHGGRPSKKYTKKGDPFMDRPFEIQFKN